MAEVEEVVGLLKEAKVEEAIQLMPEVEDKKTLSQRLVDLGGFFAEVKARYHLAVALLLLSLRFNPQNKYAAYNLANTYSTPYMLIEEPRNLDKAVYWYGKAIEIDSRFHEARYNLALLFFFNQKTVEARKQYEQLMSIKPRHPKYRELGLLLKALK
ncbi:MAG: hypothetical protein GF334_04085 [Candidatus Altiarchaeales archaeon]|nr:hypothetical protein [Candidatus Altiarchaeales archaeon]